MITFYTLLHIDELQSSMHNTRAKDFKSQIKIYLDCALVLKKSLLAQGINLKLITNNKNFIYSIINESLDIVEFEFNLAIPSGIRFYSAHYKVQLFEYLSKTEDEYVGIIDNDVVCLNNLPISFINAINNKIPLYYDISNQIYPAVSQERVLREKQTLSSECLVGLWAGGEFLCGPPVFFDTLYKEISSFMSVYFENFREYHHQGDEFLTSVALENIILKNKITVLDAGKLGLISRYWSKPTIHIQSEIDSVKDFFLLHLPADKVFISNQVNELELSSFFTKYKKYLLYTRIKNPVLSLGKNSILTIRRIFPNFLKSIKFNPKHA